MSATTFSAAATATTAPATTSIMTVQKESLFEEGIPHVIAPDLYDYVFARGHAFVSHESDRILVHRKTIAYLDQNYTIDYIVSQQDGGWVYSTVAYRSQSPFPHTIDLRLQSLAQRTHTHVSGASSASFAASAYAMMAKQHTL